MLISYLKNTLIPHFHKICSVCFKFCYKNFLNIPMHYKIIMSSSCVDRIKDINNAEEISRLSAEIALLKDELDKKTKLLEIKQVKVLFLLN